MKDLISVVIPAYNEELGVGKVIAEIHSTLRNQYAYEIIVVDNNSTDRTAEVAKDAGARVVFEAQQGYGSALTRGFSSVDRNANIVVMLDADYTYLPSSIPKLIEPILKNQADFVIGARIYKEKGSMSLLNRFGNKILDTTLSIVDIKVSDGQSGFRAMKKSVIDKLVHFLISDNMAFIQEMLIHSHNLGFRITEVPIPYRHRIGKSKLNPVRDGLWMMGTTLRITRDHSPLKIFGVLFILFEVAAALLGAYVLYRRFFEG